VAWRALPLLAGLADLGAGFRAVSGLVLALFITAVAVAVITTQNTKRSGPVDGASARNVLVDRFEYRASTGHGSIPPGFPAAVVSCAQLASTPALGRCPARTAAAKVSPFLTSGHFADRNLAGITWPAADIPPNRLASLPLYSLDLATPTSSIHTAVA
jgi:hypothetical protein